MQSTTAEATISKDYIKHNLIRLIYIIIENTILEPYFQTFRPLFDEDRMYCVSPLVCSDWSDVLSTTQIRFQHGWPLVHILWTVTYISDADTVCWLANSAWTDLFTGSARLTFWARYTGIWTTPNHEAHWNRLGIYRFLWWGHRGSLIIYCHCGTAIYDPILFTAPTIFLKDLSSARPSLMLTGHICVTQICHARFYVAVSTIV